MTPFALPSELQRFERELLAWFVSWAPYGGAPDDETFPEFGLSTSEATDRVTILVCQRLSGELPTPAADRVLVARAWLALRPASLLTHSRQARAAMHAEALKALSGQGLPRLRHSADAHPAVTSTVCRVLEGDNDDQAAELVQQSR